jgi:hypothetical protein
MFMTIKLPAEIESRLVGQASRLGMDPEEYATKLIVEHLPSVPENQSLAALLDKWDEEDQTDDPEEIARRETELEEFKRSMNRNRLEMEGPGSRKLFP